jgi:uncharacterized protein YjiS (DUF1127 family)
MITLEKETKIKLLKAIKTGVFDAEQFPELRTELHQIKIEVIRRADQVRKLEEMTDDQLDDKITDLEKKLN